MDDMKILIVLILPFILFADGFSTSVNLEGATNFQQLAELEIENDESNTADISATDDESSGTRAPRFYVISGGKSKLSLGCNAKIFNYPGVFVPPPKIG